MEKLLNRDDLICICRDSVVNHRDWHDRDSNSAQIQLNDIYNALTAGIEYTYKTDNRTIWITFEKATYDDLSKGSYLDISSIDDYRLDCDPNYENEMFEGHGLDLTDGDFGYIPTRERLDEANGYDWY